MKLRLLGGAKGIIARAALVCLALAGSRAFAQEGLVIAVSAPSGATENNPVNIRADVRSFTNVSQAILFYRNDLSSDYQQADLTFDQSTMTLNGTVPSSYVVSPYIEVYVRLIKSDGTSETYPVESPTENPVRIPVAAAEVQQDILVISPDRNQRLTIDDLMIAASMLYAPADVDRHKTKLYLDGADVTPEAVISGDIIVYNPSNSSSSMAQGLHTVRVVLYKSDGFEYRTLDWSFFILTPGQERAAEAFTYQGNAQVELRNEDISGSSTWYNRGDLNFGSTLYGVNLGANFHLTSEEKSYRQPQDRYGLFASTSWLSLKLGDSYPAFSPLIMNGLRVRGISGKITTGVVNVEAAYGQTVRGIDGQYIDTVRATSDTSFVKLNDSTFANVIFGTYTRNLFALRPSFDFGSHAELGFTYLKSQDAISSVGLGNNPNQNVVLGSDFAMNFDNRHINFLAEAAMSMLNQNISVGNRSATDIDTISHSDAGDQINKIIPISTLSKIITINEFLVPLDPTKLSSLAWDVGLNLNYFNTYAKVGYVYRGPDYTSFGQPYIRTDIRGYDLLLRPRLLNNQILLSLSYENLFDNLQRNKFATTQYATTNVSASYFPSPNLPNFTLGFSAYSNFNSINPDSNYATDNVTDRYYIESTYGFNYMIRHSLSVNFGISQRTDHILLGTNLNNFNLAFLLNSDFGEFPLKTTIGFNINGNKTTSHTLSSDSTTVSDSLAMVEQQIETFNYTFLTFGLTYGLMNDQFTIGVNYTPTFGDFSRNTFGLTASYRVAKSQSLNLSLNYFAVPGANDFVGSLIYAVDF